MKPSSGPPDGPEDAPTLWLPPERDIRSATPREWCAFCGQAFGPRDTPRERTGEHALASWMGNVILGSGLLTHRRQSTAGGPLDQIWTKDELDIVAKQVCGACNHNWMSRLETGAAPYLTPLIQGQRKHLDETEQELIAAWAAKTALALHLTTPEKGAPVEHYREMATTHRAPVQSVVLLAAYDAALYAAYHESHLLDLITPTLDADGYWTTFAVGHLVVQVFGYRGVEDVITVSKRDTTLQIHPFERSITWPPPIVLNAAGLDAFASACPSG